MNGPKGKQRCNLAPKKISVSARASSPQDQTPQSAFGRLVPARKCRADAPSFAFALMSCGSSLGCSIPRDAWLSRLEVS